MNMKKCSLLVKPFSQTNNSTVHPGTIALP